MLSFTNLSVSRGGKALFSGLGLTLFPGSAMIIRGGNGLGKTTLLRTLAGLMKPEQGDVTWNDVSIWDEYDTYCQLISYLGHKHGVKSELTVAENVAFWSRLKHSEEMVPAALSYFQLDDKLDMPGRVLSAGWKQRVALARVMASPAPCWLLDEPTTHLDAEGIDRLMHAITVRCREGGMVIMTTHAELPLKGAVLCDMAEWRCADGA